MDGPLQTEDDHGRDLGPGGAGVKDGEVVDVGDGVGGGLSWRAGECTRGT